MSYVDQPEHQPRSFSERFQDVWDHPTPFSLFAQIKALRDLPQTIRDMVDASRVVTGPAPTTEEEAYIYDKARDYLPRAGFELASAVSPTVPKVVGGLPIRPTRGLALRAEGTAQPTNGLLPGGSRSARSEPYTQPPAVLRPGAGEGAGSGILGGLTSSSTEFPWWMQAVLPPGAMPVGAGGLLPAGAVRRQALPPTTLGPNRSFGVSNAFSGRPNPEMPPSRPPFAPEASGGGRLPPSIVGLAGLQSDHRELRRVDTISRGTVQSGDDGNPKPSPGIQSPPLVPDQEPPWLDLDTGGVGSGGSGGNGGRGGDDAERKRECNEQWQDERDNYCPQFRPAGDVYERMCREVAAVRLKQCYRNEPEREKFAWRDVDPEDLKAYRKWARAQLKKRQNKPGNRG